MSRRPPGRLLAAMVTPFGADGEVDVPEAARLARRLVAEGCDGVVVAGTTGEGSTLSREEKLALFAGVAEALAGRGSVVANVGGNDTRASIALAREAAQIGVDAALAVVPYYNRPTPEGMLRHFGALAEATDLPIVVYNIPGRTGVNMDAATLLELARRHPTVAGVKESSGDFRQFTEILRGRAPGFAFWSGDDPFFLPTLAIGGDGLISVAAHLCARELRATLDAVDRGDLAAARRLHAELAPLCAALFATTNPSPVKWALARAGLPVGEPRAPLAPLPEALGPQVAAAVEPYLARLRAPLAA